MYDLIIRNGAIIDGTGAPARPGDIAVKDGRIAAIGTLSGGAATTIDAEGKLVAPGFIDPHTHYDAQLFWDGYATPSSLHGVTTIICGNCGFTLAPLRPQDADYLRRMMAQVEGMPLEALEQGLPWDWSSFGDFIGNFDGKLGVNAAFMVGHSAIRRMVMGSDATGNTATAAQVEQMIGLLHDALAAGALGFSTSLSFTHIDGDGKPVPSRYADWAAEVLPLTRAVKDHPGTTLEFIVDGCIGRFNDDEIKLMIAMSAGAERPLNWNVLQIKASDREHYEHQLSASREGARQGAHIRALTMPVHVPMCLSFLTHCALHLLPGWGEILRLPVDARIEALKDPAVRLKMMEDARRPEAGTLASLVNWSRYTIGSTFSAENEGLNGRNLGAIAAERGIDPTDCLFDIVIADGLRTVLWPNVADDSPESWAFRSEAWSDKHILIGGSDAGAHLDRMSGAAYPASFVEDCLRGKRLVPVERAINLMTKVPAELFGLVDRGELREGFKADIVILDPQRVGTSEVERAVDLPGGAWRLTSFPKGVDHVFVNGVEIVREGKTTGELPGQVLRSGQDTITVTPADLN